MAGCSILLRHRASSVAFGSVVQRRRIKPLILMIRPVISIVWKQGTKASEEDTASMFRIKVSQVEEVKHTS
jgi:hypothetical protein